jgi:hypothetical protein
VIILYNIKTHSGAVQSLTHTLPYNIKTHSGTMQSLTHTLPYNIKTHSGTLQSLTHTLPFSHAVLHICISSVRTKNEKKCLLLKSLLNVIHKSPTRGPSGCITRPAGSFVHYACTTKFTHTIRPLGILLTAGFRRAFREPTHNTVCGPVPSKVWRSLEERKTAVACNIFISSPSSTVNVFMEISNVVWIRIRFPVNVGSPPFTLCPHWPEDHHSPLSIRIRTPFSGVMRSKPTTSLLLLSNSVA